MVSAPLIEAVLHDYHLTDPAFAQPVVIVVSAEKSKS